MTRPIEIFRAGTAEFAERLQAIAERAAAQDGDVEPVVIGLSA